MASTYGIIFAGSGPSPYTLTFEEGDVDSIGAWNADAYSGSGWLEEATIYIDLEQQFPSGVPTHGMRGDPTGKTR